MGGTSRERMRGTADLVRERLLGGRGDRGMSGPAGMADLGLYVNECFLRALAASPSGPSFAVKGGLLFRLWGEIVPPRPTSGLDLQRLTSAGDPGGGPDALRAEVEALVCTEEFGASTGLAFDPGSFRCAVAAGGQRHACRLEGVARLGDAPDAPEVPFCLEVTHGPAPEGALAKVRWVPVLAEGGGFEVTASRPEWMAADKFHAVISRGIANSRARDYRDLALLLVAPGFEDPLFASCVRQVFDELGHARLLPRAAADTPTLTPLVATMRRSAGEHANNEHAWQAGEWPRWTGRAFDPASDRTLTETVAHVVAGLERAGVLARPPAGRLAGGLADLHRASDLGEPPLAPVRAAKFIMALKEVCAAAEGIGDGPAADAALADAAWRWAAISGRAGLRASPAGTVFLDAMRRAEKAGLLPAIERGWNRGRGGANKAVMAVGALLTRMPGLAAAATAPPPRPATGVVAAKEPEPARGIPAPAAAPAVQAPQPRKAGPTRQPDALRMMCDGLVLLAQGEPGGHIWLGGLARVLECAGGPVPDTTGVVLEMPGDPRAPAIWARIARKRGFEPDLARAVEQAREVLCLASAGPAPR